MTKADRTGSEGWQGERSLLKVGRGSILFHAGQVCSGFVIVHAGTIKVTPIAENGREIILYRVRPGEVCLQTFGCLVTKEALTACCVSSPD